MVLCCYCKVAEANESQLLNTRSMTWIYPREQNATVISMCYILVCFQWAYNLRITLRILIGPVIFANILEKFSVFEITYLDTWCHMYVQFTSCGQGVRSFIKISRLWFPIWRNRQVSVLLVIGNFSRIPWFNSSFVF